MVCNLNSGRIYKGSAAEITVPVVPACVSAMTDDIVARFYTTNSENCIEFSATAGTMTIDGNNGTVYFQPEQLEALEDGQLRYTSILDGYFAQDWETAYFLVTPQPHTVIDFVTEDEVAELVTDLVSTAMTGYATEEELSEYAKLTDIPSLAGYATTDFVNSSLSAATQNMVTSTSITNIWVGTEAQYDAITNKDNTTLYIIK